MHSRRVAYFLTGMFSFLFLSGCATVGLALLGAGAGVTTGAAVAYTLDGYAYRTFTTSLPRLETATLTALNRMGIKVEGNEKTDQGKVIRAVGAERQIEIQLETISAKTTRLRTVAKQGVFFKDRATATEIIAQTEKALGAVRS